VVVEGCVKGNDTKILETRLEICSKTEKMKGQGLGVRGLIVEITGKYQAGSPRFILLHHYPHPGNEPGLEPHPCGAAIGLDGWCGGAFGPAHPYRIGERIRCMFDMLLGRHKPQLR